MVTFADAGWSPDMHVSMWMARETCARVYRELFRREMVITSGMRPQRPGGSSLHATGHAMDIRTRDLSTSHARLLAQRCAEALGEDFDVILEGPQGTDPRYRDRPAHLHVEYDPKGRHAQRLAQAEQED